MYFPYLTKRPPSNFECRIASAVSIIGFVGFGWLLWAVPDTLISMLAWLAAVELILAYFGLGTLHLARPNHFLMWPQRATQVVRGQPVPALDERDLNIRYRTFLVSYRILSLAAFAVIVFISPGARFLVNTSAGRIPQWRLEAAQQMFVVLIYLLSIFLPYWVFPWLESDAAFDDEPPADPGLQNAAQLPPWRRRYWSRTGVANLFLWISIFLLMVWLFRRYTHSH